jgi:hypothetical protein
LQNAVYTNSQSEADRASTKSLVLAALPWTKLVALLDNDDNVQAHMVGVLRNLLYGETADVAGAVAGFGGVTEMVECIGRLLGSTRTAVLLQALGTVSNIAAAGECEHKDAIVANRPVMAAIVRSSCLVLARKLLLLEGCYAAGSHMPGVGLKPAYVWSNGIPCARVFSLLDSVPL